MAFIYLNKITVDSTRDIQAKKGWSLTPYEIDGIYLIKPIRDTASNYDILLQDKFVEFDRELNVLPKPAPCPDGLLLEYKDGFLIGARIEGKEWNEAFEKECQTHFHRIESLPETHQKCVIQWTMY